MVITLKGWNIENATKYWVRNTLSITTNVGCIETNIYMMNKYNAIELLSSIEKKKWIHYKVITPKWKLLRKVDQL